jgi:hypothetical protein
MYQIPGLENREYGSRDPSQNLALTSPTSSGLSVGIVRSRTKTTEFIIIMNQIDFIYEISNLWIK